MPVSTRNRIERLRRRLASVMLVDEPAFRRRLARLARADAGILASLEAEIEASAGRVTGRAAAGPMPLAPGLPVSERADEIAAAIGRYSVVVVCGETGSGKTTQLPRICARAGLGLRGTIGHTQPRRLAARAVAARIAEELGEPLGRRVGFRVRFSDHTGPDCRIKLMTDGILLNEIRRDRLLRQYDALIVDEAHERSLNIDFLLGYLKTLLPRRPDLRVVITSATIDPERFARHFDDAPVIEVSGRSWPVELRYRPLAASEDDPGARTQVEAVLDAVDELAADGLAGDVLVFLAGEREIRDTADALRRHHPTGVEVLPLFARLSAADQDRIFHRGHRHRIVLATNIAETSLTVPGIRYVVDPGTARISRYSYRSKIQRLRVEPVSRASADQRQGRCGREAPGTCLRLYSEEDFLARPAFTDPEILRTHLASVILRMADLDLGHVTDFPFVDPPDARYVRDGYRLLRELGAVDGRDRVTPMGHRIARLPVDPRLGRILLAAGELACLAEMLPIASALSIQDPRERPADKTAEADARHAAWQVPGSDFLGLARLWEEWRSRRRHLSASKLRRWCRESFLSYVRMREWHDVHQQLGVQLGEMGIKPNREPASPEAVHRALLTGFLGHVGLREEGRDYTGPRDTRFRLSPGSALADKPPRWVVTASLVETTRVWGSTAAAIEPDWIEAAAGHLVRRSWQDPHWDSRRGHVVALESVSLYGLVLVAGRLVDYGRVAPAESRPIFLREGLARGRVRTRGGFLEHNRHRLEEVHGLEARLRRRDLAADEVAVATFYADRVPEAVVDTPGFERWRRVAEGRRPGLLEMTREDVLASDPPDWSPEDYPDHLLVQGNRLAIDYRFEPGSPDDGATLSVPRSLLPMLDPVRLEWLLPGWLGEKLTELIRGLPKPLRRRLVPAPDVARRCLATMAGQGDLFDHYAAALGREAGVRADPAELRRVRLPEHLVFNIRVLGAGGRVLETSRDLAALRERHAPAGPVPVRDTVARRGLTEWPGETLAATREVVVDGRPGRLYQGLRDEGDSVSVALFASAGEAEGAHRQGVVRLAMLALARETRYLEREFRRSRALTLGAVAMAGDDPVMDLLRRVLEETLLGSRPAPRERAAFAAMLETARGGLVEAGNRQRDLAERILESGRALRLALEGGVRGAGGATATRDVTAQLDALMVPGFLRDTPSEWLREIPRYLEAARRRLEAIAGGDPRDPERLAALEPFLARLRAALERLPAGAAPPPVLIRYRWLIEEYRVSLFAQGLGTSVKVSPERLERQWGLVRSALERL